MVIEILTSFIMLHNANIINHDRRQIECLANNIYHEGRNQTKKGQEAIANVVFNRVKSPKFPNDICLVVYQAKLKHNGVPKRNKCSFSWWCDGKSDKIYNKRIYTRIYKFSSYLYYHKNTLPDLTNGAVYYHADYVHPYWIKKVNYTRQIGDHIFYKN